MEEILAKIEQADDEEIRQIMDAVERRYAFAFPDWDVVYIAMPKDPVKRRVFLDGLTAQFEKELRRYEEQWEERKDSLG